MAINTDEDTTWQKYEKENIDINAMGNVTNQTLMIKAEIG